MKEKLNKSNMHHYVYKLEDKLGAFYFGVRSSFVAPEKDSYMGSGVWPKECRRSGVTLQKSIISTHPSRSEACIAESQCINDHIDNEMLMNRYFGVQNHQLGPREASSGNWRHFGADVLNSAFWVSETVETRIVWITLLALADSDGRVNSSMVGLAERSGVSMHLCMEAIGRMKEVNHWESKKMQARTVIKETEYGWMFPGLAEQ